MVEESSSETEGPLEVGETVDGMGGRASEEAFP